MPDGPPPLLVVLMGLLALAIVVLNDRIKAGQRSSKQFARGMKWRAVFWPVLILISGTGLTVGLAASPGGLQPRTLAIMLALTGVGAVAAHVVYRAKAEAGPPPAPAPRPAG